MAKRTKTLMFQEDHARLLERLSEETCLSQSVILAEMISRWRSEVDLREWIATTRKRLHGV